MYQRMRHFMALRKVAASKCWSLYCILQHIGEKTWQIVNQCN